MRRLEDALEVLQSQCSNQPHPLLAPELLSIKTSQELYGTVNPPNPHASSATPTSTTDHSANSRDGNGGSLTMDNQSQRGGDMMEKDLCSGREPSPPEVAPDILQLSTTFPFPWMVDVSIRKRIRDALPPKAEAQRICEEARANALWQ